MFSCCNTYVELLVRYLWNSIKFGHRLDASSSSLSNPRKACSASYFDAKQKAMIVARP